MEEEQEEEEEGDAPRGPLRRKFAWSDFRAKSAEPATSIPPRIGHPHWTSWKGSRGAVQRWHVPLRAAVAATARRREAKNHETLRFNIYNEN